MNKQDLHGMLPAIVTPFAENGEIMEDGFRQIVENLIGIGSTGICVAGDNGESWAVSAAERGRLVRLAVDTSAGRVPVICGCSAPTLDAALGYARAAQENGAVGLLSMPPTYVLKGSRAEIVGRYAKIAAAVDLPMVAYNSPRRHGYSLSMEDIAAICDAAPVIGIKESNRDFFHHTHLLDRFADKMSVMTGPCHYILPSYMLGAQGFIATGPEFLGKDAARLGEIGRAGASTEAREMHYKLTVLYELLMGIGTWPAAFKAALNLIGWPAGIPRDPVLPASEADLDRIRACFDDLGIARVA